MTKTPSAKKTPPAKQDKQAESKHYAKVSLSASTMSAVLSTDFTKSMFPDVNLADSISALSDKITTIQNGDMQPIEAMLIGQAQALQTMFVSLGRQATSKTQLAQYTAFMNLALKAQSQSRATIQALVELKYPKQTNFVKQANIASGHQQINNNLVASDNATKLNTPAHSSTGAGCRASLATVASDNLDLYAQSPAVARCDHGKNVTSTHTHTPAHTKKIDHEPNQLLEVNNGCKTMDARTTQTTIDQDIDLATVATHYRG